MEQKNRLMIVVAIVALMVVAIVTSFGRVLFAANTPDVILPSSSAGLGDLSGSAVQGPDYQRVDVTTQTVTGVVATLARPSSYYRELTVETFWNGGSSTAQVQVWTDGGWTHSVQTLPSGAVRHDLTGDGTLYYWYDGFQQYATAPADEKSSDLAQHIPTYETVLELEPEEIAAAGYELRGELPCILVEVQRGQHGLLQRFWISVDNGLLVSAESEENGQLVYRMMAYSPVQSPCPSNGSFSLPGGEVLHTVGE
ncbi:hypothetical protein [Flintibacter muris]|uniref:hypothetical protein n=1 Tax=Flintibacter muris TaxID=2941327 RepID=UPI00203D5BD1|nr:hypothetical protein [Flintibacter muris]